MSDEETRVLHLQEGAVPPKLPVALEERGTVPPKLPVQPSVAKPPSQATQPPPKDKK